MLLAVPVWLSTSSWSPVLSDVRILKCAHHALHALQIKDRDTQLAKAKRMMVALNNKFKAKFAKLEASKQAAVIPADGALQQELDELKAKLAACEEKAAARQETNTGNEQENEASDLKDTEIAELKAAVVERDEIIERAKERFQAMGQKARAAVEERNSEIESLTGQLEEVAPPRRLLACAGIFCAARCSMLKAMRRSYLSSSGALKLPQPRASSLLTRAFRACRLSSGYRISACNRQSQRASSRSWEAHWRQPILLCQTPRRKTQAGSDVI